MLRQELLRLQLHTVDLIYWYTMDNDGLSIQLDYQAIGVEFVGRASQSCSLAVSQKVRTIFILKNPKLPSANRGSSIDSQMSHETITVTTASKHHCIYIKKTSLPEQMNFPQVPIKTRISLLWRSDCFRNSESTNISFGLKSAVATAIESHLPSVSRSRNLSMTITCPFVGIDQRIWQGVQLCKDVRFCTLSLSRSQNIYLHMRERERAHQIHCCRGRILQRLCEIISSDFLLKLRLHRFPDTSKPGGNISQRRSWPVLCNYAIRSDKFRCITSRSSPVIKILACFVEYAIRFTSQ